MEEKEKLDIKKNPRKKIRKYISWWKNNKIDIKKDPVKK